MSQESNDFAGLKIDQLHAQDYSIEGFAYYCRLCHEVLVLSKQLINPRKVSLAFNETCPGCGFHLGIVLECEASRIPERRDILVNPKCLVSDCLLTQPSEQQFTFTTGRAPVQNQRITTGIEYLDSKITLDLGHLAVLQGKATNSLSSLLCVRAVLPKPIGLDSEVVYIDGGNVFDAYLISEHAVKHEFDTEKVLTRIHLSRAFTYHQLSRLITEKLPEALAGFNARLVVISDITFLYCDPDIKDKQEALNVFRRDVRSLAALAEQQSALIVATNLQARNRRMNTYLLHTAHVSAKVDGWDTFIQLTLARHPYTPQLNATITVNRQTLESYM